MLNKYKVVVQCTQVREYVYFVTAPSKDLAEDGAKYRYLLGYDANDSSGVISDDVSDVYAKKVTTW